MATPEWRLDAIRVRAAERMIMSSKDTYGASGKGDLFWFDYPRAEGEAHALTLVKDKGHPLYDERVNLPLDEAMVQNIMVYGIIEPLVVRLNGKLKDGSPNVEIADGRQRYSNGYEANKRLLAEGKTPIRVPAIVKGGDAHTLFGVMISSNVHRRGEEQLDLAAKVSRFLAMNGASKREAAVTFGFKTPATVDTYLALHEKAHDAVKAKIRAGMPVMVAKELLDLPQEEQPAALAKLEEAGALSGARGVEAAREVRQGRAPVSDKERVMSSKRIEAWCEALKEVRGKEADAARSALLRVLGRERALAQYPQIRGALPEKPVKKEKTKAEGK